MGVSVQSKYLLKLPFIHSFMVAHESLLRLRMDKYKRDMHKDLCKGRPGLCDAMRPTKGAELLKYLRNVEFQGKFN